MGCALFLSVFLRGSRSTASAKYAAAKACLTGTTWSSSQVPAVSPQPHSAHLPFCAARIFCLSAAPDTFRFAFSSFRKISCAKPREWLRGSQAPLGRQFMFGLSFSASRCQVRRTSARFLQDRLESVSRAADLSKSQAGFRFFAFDGLVPVASRQFPVVFRQFRSCSVSFRSCSVSFRSCSVSFRSCSVSFRS